MGCAAKRGVQKTEGRKVGRAGSKNVAVGTSLHIVLDGGGGRRGLLQLSRFNSQVTKQKKKSTMFTLERGATVLDACLGSIRTLPLPFPPTIILNVCFQDNKGFHNTTPSAIEGLVMSGVLTSPLLCVCECVCEFTWSYLLKLQPSSTNRSTGWVSHSFKDLSSLLLWEYFHFFYFHETTEQTEMASWIQHPGRRWLHKKKRA